MPTKVTTILPKGKRTRTVGKLCAILVILTSFMIATGVSIKLNTPTLKVKLNKNEATITYSPEDQPTYMYDEQGELIEVTEYNGMDIPTVEEVDGGLFEDIANEGDYDDLGWAETYNVSSPEAFRDDTLNKCIVANNRYGAQCVSLARVFWWSYANRDVSTCGTGMAKGMMNCTELNAEDDFLVFWGSEGIEDGDWVVSDGGRYGHIGMALSPVTNGYVTLLGENQGGRSCEAGGSATNIINFNVKNVIGYYRPKAYIKPAPIPVTNCTTWNVKEGDTMSKIMLSCEATIKYGKVMDEYAKTWYSLIMNPGQSVYDGWSSKNGVGLYIDDTIEHRV